MRYQPDHKERTHRQIVETAARMFRKNGVVATGVVPLMKEAGLTQGGFYAHFPSKEALVREAATAAIDQTADGLRKVAEGAGDGVTALRALIEAYLSEGHLERTETGCAVAAVGAELAREPQETRGAVMTATRKILSLIEELLPEGAAEPRSVAGSVFALMSGTLQLARLAADPAEAQQLLRSGRKSALRLAGVSS